MEQKIAIQTEEIKRYFPSGDGNIVRALDGVSMEIPSGSLTILKGRSGSGKTTLLNILSALDVPTEGKVEFFGKDLKSLKNREREDLRRYRMGFVFQSVALIPVMTAYENVEFALRLSGDRKPGVEERQAKGERKNKEKWKNTEAACNRNLRTGRPERTDLSYALSVVRRRAAAGGNCPGSCPQTTGDFCRRTYRCTGYGIGACSHESFPGTGRAGTYHGSHDHP